MENNSTYFYFSYGSNMLKERIQINDPNAKPYAAARLDDFRLEFNYRSLRWMGAVATIVETHGCHLWGVVWIKNNDTITSLDDQEGVHQGIYKPLTVKVTTVNGETLNCRCYQQICEWEVDRRPSVVYKNIMIKGAKENGVPEDYIKNNLENIEDNGYNGEVQVKMDLLQKN
ncbi:gamma-glutamylcyclotransferase-like [Daphnia pulex]|uniref:gamma-glutamylcyclotransferase-like n=1 Tax=Daphnia pulex TaxID=6669 RepID=UPI001EDF677E|nr:gamma-glutamylcyclotransferase-like [Daphnia pulex]XP_046635386.1 gamma-glutamylcyclotransferase-like [Daphnia pulicaria]